MVELKGVIPAITTPFNEDGSLDLDGFRKLVDIIIEDGVHGIVPNGCTGESWALSDDERAEIFKATVEVTAGRIPVVPGCGAMSAADAIHKVHQAEAAGCDAVMIQPPWYVMPGLDEIFDYYKKIIDATDLPIMAYNIPRRTGICFTADFVDQLADEPRIVALKESSKNWLLLSEIIRRCKDRITILAGYAPLLGLAAITEGALGFVDSAAPVVGSLMIDFYDAASAGDIEKARPLQAELAKINKGMFGIGTFPAANKAALDMLSRPGGWTRDPIKPLNDEQRVQVRQVLITAGVLPAEDALRATA
ncbi:MAG: 4-hydroxy-tetrahydrodipicolinate synthase [Rhodospirillales bacterium]|jgi:4-hydroxy-tetrahydrodipicolinate synthase|nr:4-hydroxy-tetrahydrodipicolinate synthase [Rhodospirillales bacterium]